MTFPLVLPTAALAAGIAVGIFFPTDPFLTRLSAPPLQDLLIGVAYAFRPSHIEYFSPKSFPGFAVAGELIGARANLDALQTPLRTLFDRHLPANEYQMFATIDGTLRADATRGANGISLRLDVDRIVVEGRRQSTLGGVIIGVGGEETAPVEEWRAGRRLRVQATLRRPATYLDPGVRDSQREFGWRGTSLVGSVKSPRLVEVLERGSWLDEWLAAIRWSLRHSVASCVVPWSERSAAVVIAILIGDRAGLDDDMQRQLQEAGTITSSRSRAATSRFSRRCVCLLCGVSGFGVRGSAVIIIVVLVVYAFVVGDSGGASVGRATLMAVIYFIAQLSDQRSSAGNVAALSAGLLFCVAPLEVVDASFALTFGATLGLIVGMPRLTRPDWMPGWIFAGVALLGASVCAEVALLPIGAFVFSRVTAAGLLLNFAAIPLMTVVQIGGMIAVALDHLSGRAARWVGFVAHLGVRGLLASASLVELAPWVARRVPPPSLFLMCGYYASLILALMLSGRKRIAFAGATLLCGWLMITTLGFPSWTSTNSSLRVTFLDVGQGDAAVVQFPDGHTLSIDAGGIAGTTFDIGGRVVSPTYWALGIRRLDYMSISHSDPDHIGGAASVFRDFHPREIWEGVPVPPNVPTKALRTIADNASVVWHNLQVNDHFSFGRVELFVRHPPPPDWERQKVRNNDSEVLELRYGDVSFVFTGDIGREVEHDIAASFAPAPIRILKVPHHGSGTSSSMEFLEALRPSVAVISAGRGNPFGHPVPTVVARYHDIGAAIFRTDQDGAISVETDGKTVHVQSFTKRSLTLRSHAGEH